MESGDMLKTDVLSDEIFVVDDDPALGADGVIAKPFDPMTLAASVRNYLPTETSVEVLRKAFVRRAKMDAEALIPFSSALEERLIPRSCCVVSRTLRMG
jgi:hypothetical protein